MSSHTKQVQNTRKPPAAGKGRPKGSLNKTTVFIKQAILDVYAKLQDEQGEENGHFHAWAKENPTEFYKIASKLIPQDMNANVIHSLPSVSPDDFC